MTTWFEAVAALRSAREAGVLVTVTDVRGHAPREAGAKMVVSPPRRRGRRSAAATWRRRRYAARATSSRRVPSPPESFTAHLSDKAPFQHGVQCCGGEVGVLLEPLAVVPSVALFGIGHVGLELARILARHDLDLHLVDSRSSSLTAESLASLDDAVAAVHVHQVPVLPELVLAELPPGTHVLVLTHDHAEDLAICDAAIRAEHLGPDRADRVVRQVGQVPLAAARRPGTPPTTVDRIRTPIGLPGLTTSKEPAAIAVSVAAELLAAFEREGARLR